MVPLVKIRLVKLSAFERSTLGPTNISIFKKTSLKENWKLMIMTSLGTNDWQPQSMRVQFELPSPLQWLNSYVSAASTFDHIACLTLTGSYIFPQLLPQKLSPCVSYNFLDVCLFLPSPEHPAQEVCPLEGHLHPQLSKEWGDASARAHRHGWGRGSRWDTLIWNTHTHTPLFPRYQTVLSCVSSL